jgi:hypothetical protein
MLYFLSHHSITHIYIYNNNNIYYIQASTVRACMCANHGQLDSRSPRRRSNLTPTSSSLQTYIYRSLLVVRKRAAAAADGSIGGSQSTKGEEYNAQTHKKAASFSYSKRIQREALAGHVHARMVSWRLGVRTCMLPRRPSLLGMGRVRGRDGRGVTR